jgi:hypothetical protein
VKIRESSELHCSFDAAARDAMPDRYGEPLLKRQVFLISAVLSSGASVAFPSCQAEIDKVASGFAAAINMSDADGAAKCSALSRVILDADDLAFACVAPEDRKLLQDKYLPLAKSLAEEVVKACSR